MLSCCACEAYIRPEYAKANKHLLLTVPYNLPVKKMRRSFALGFGSRKARNVQNALRQEGHQALASCGRPALWLSETGGRLRCALALRGLPVKLEAEAA